MDIYYNDKKSVNQVTYHEHPFRSNKHCLDTKYPTLNIHCDDYDNGVVVRHIVFIMMLLSK